jgi:hypothetical protein
MAGDRDELAGGEADALRLLAEDAEDLGLRLRLMAEGLDDARGSELGEDADWGSGVEAGEAEATGKDDDENI